MLFARDQFAVKANLLYQMREEHCSSIKITGCTITTAPSMPRGHENDATMNTCGLLPSHCVIYLQLQTKQKIAQVEDNNAIGITHAAIFSINFTLLRQRTPTIYF